MELTCLVCRNRFTPICEQQRCCTGDCGIRAGRDWEYTYVLSALDKMFKDAYVIEMNKDV